MRSWIVHILIFIFPILASAAPSTMSCAKAHAPSASIQQLEALQALQDHIQTMPMIAGRPPHELEIINGKGVLKVGLLINTEKRFSAYLIRTLKLGAISEIDGGTVVGPKVLLLLSQIRSISPTPVLVRGSLISDFVFPALESDIKGSKLWEEGKGPRPDFPWSSTEIQSLHQALDDLKIKEACLQLWNTARLKNCGRMSFQFRTPDLQSIEWTR